MSGERGGVQVRIKRKYENANFVHCYAHQLSLGIPAFFSDSPQRVAVLNQIVGRNLPRSVPTRWNFNIRTVNVVYEYRDSTIECMEHLEEDSKVLTCKQASGIRRILQDSNLIF